MANYKQVSYGSQGSDVTELQKRLNQTGFKPTTGASVMNTATKAVTDGVSNGGYQPSDAVKQAEAMLKQQMANKPGSYQSPWQAQLDEIMGKIMNREKFSYDLNGDALYQQYKDQYMLQGQQAMMDTMGQAQAMTGGYGNSYAQTAGQQAYQGHLQQLGDKIPELYALALDKYQMEGQELMDQFSMIGARDEQDYGRYRDSVSDYYADLDRAYDQYADERDHDYGQYIDDRNYQYQQDRDKAADEQWQKEFDEAKRQYDQKNGGGSGSSGGSSSDGSNYDANTAKIQQELRDAGYDIDVDGVWGPKTQAAYDAYKNGGGGAKLSSNGEKFMNQLPYPHAGSDMDAWKNVVDERLERALNNGTLTESDVMIILDRLGLA